MTGLAAYGHWIEPSWLQVRRTTVSIPGLPNALQGMVIAHLSDFHLGRSFDPHGPVAQAIAACDAARPDAVVLTGDFISGRRSISALATALRQLSARPVFAVYGNHDYRFGPNHRRTLQRVLTDLGITVLDNRAVAFDHRGERVWFIGVGDAYTSHDRLDVAQGGLTDGDRPRILLTHYPDLLFDVPANQFDLVLAGHTHGGQINLPFIVQRALAHSDTAFSSGLFHVSGVPLYVNRGLETSNQRIRLFARPELALITFHD